MDGAHVQSLVYSMVARGEVMLAHYSPFPSAIAAFAALAAACLPNLGASSSSSSSSSRTSTSTSTFTSSPSSSPATSSSNVLSYKCDDAHTFHFLLDDCISYLVVSSNLEGQEIAPAFLHHIKEEFHKRYGDATVDSERFTTHSLEKDIGPRLKEHMQYCIDNSQKLKELPSIKDQTSQVKKVVPENIEKVLDSKKSLHLRVESIEVFRAHVENFHRQGQKLKKEMRTRQIKLRLLVLLVSVIIILSIWLIVCKGFEC